MNNQIHNSTEIGGTSPPSLVDIYRDNRLHGFLRIPDSCLSDRQDHVRRRIYLSSGRDDHWRRTSRFIQQRYHDAFDACITVTFPELMWVCDQSGSVLAAAGVRSAEAETLFLEQYLSEPVEKSISVNRDRIVEIGNLVSVDKAATDLLFCALALVLERRGITHAAATGTRLLEKRMRCLGLRMTRVCEASIDKLSGETDQWGRYYSSNPHVLVGSVAECAKNLRSKLLVELTNPAVDKALHCRTVCHNRGYVQ